MIAVIDYGAGNLFSVCNALKYLNIAHTVTKDAEELDRADAVILPGVGAFPAAMASLRETGLVDRIKENAMLRFRRLKYCMITVISMSRTSRGTV